MIIFPLVVGHLLNSNGLLLSVCSIVGRISPEQRSQSVTFFSAVVFLMKVSLDPEPVSHYHNQYGTKLEIQSSATQIEICNLNINETTSLHCPSKIRVQTMHIAWLLSRRLCFFRWSSSIRSRKLSLK